MLFLWPLSATDSGGDLTIAGIVVIGMGSGSGNGIGIVGIWQLRLAAPCPCPACLGRAAGGPIKRALDVAGGLRGGIVRPLPPALCLFTGNRTISSAGTWIFGSEKE